MSKPYIENNHFSVDAFDVNIYLDFLTVISILGPWFLFFYSGEANRKTNQIYERCQRMTELLEKNKSACVQNRCIYIP